ncbi:MAG: hypothetical protein QM654_06450 [Dysgonamonadaceae bacterium]
MSLKEISFMLWDSVMTKVHYETSLKENTHANMDDRAELPKWCQWMLVSRK